MANKVIGVFGGSFSPPHLGHRQVVSQILNKNLADEVWLLPCGEHAFGKDLLPVKQRLTQLAAMIKTLSPPLQKRVRVEEFELKNSGMSITYDTLMALKAREPNLHFQFIIGTDQVKTFDQWHHYQDLLEKFPTLVYPREPNLQPPLLSGMILLQNFPTINVSSTLIKKMQQANNSAWKKLVFSPLN